MKSVNIYFVNRLHLSAIFLFIAITMMVSGHGVAQDALALNSPASINRDRLYDNLALSASRNQSHFLMVRQIVKVTKPSVVHIEAKKNQSQVSTSNSGTPRSVVEEAGSGIVLSYKNKSFIITNYHVVESSSPNSIKVEADGKLFYPTQVAHDPQTDLSILFTDRTDLTPARIGNSDETEIGEFVVAVGSPFGLSHSVSYGIISAKGRRDLELGPQGVRFQNFFQTDAAINPGNSGGPLINLNGEIIGINTAIASNSGGSDGIGFSIPIQMAMRIARDLIDYGEVRRGFLGVSLDSRYTPEKGRSIGLELNYGTRVSGVTPNSPAADADFQVGDVILEFGNKRIKSDSHLVTEVSLKEVGNTIPVKIFRAGKIRNKSVTIQDRSNYKDAK